MAVAINPRHPGGFLAIAAITAAVLLVVLPVIDKIAALAAKPLG